MEDKTPSILYTAIMNTITKAIPTAPAMAVFCKASCPNCAETTLLEISVSFTGREPELIRLARVLASVSVKLPEMTQSPLIAEETVAADIYLGSLP